MQLYNVSTVVTQFNFKIVHKLLNEVEYDVKDYVNRQYSYSPTVLGRVGLDHECEAHAGTFSPRGQTNMRELRLSFCRI